MGTLNKLQSLINLDCTITLLVKNPETNEKVIYDFYMLTFEDYEFIAEWFKAGGVNGFQFESVTFS